MAASILRPTANRALHLKITPRPSSLGESREILRLLSQFGDIEYYKNLKYDVLSHPQVALIIFKDEDAAAHCKRKSPIRFRMGRATMGEDSDDVTSTSSTPPASGIQTEQKTAAAPSLPLTEPQASSGTPFGLTQTRALSTTSHQSSVPEPPPRPPLIPFQGPTPQLLEPRLFQIQTSLARANFRDQINMGAYYGAFAIDTGSIAQKDLQKSVPALGMSCLNWRAEDKPWRLMKMEREREQNRKTLWELYEEGPEGMATEALPE